jgi:hypothetical protein
VGASVTTAAERVALVDDLERDTARRAATALATEALRTRDSCTAEHCDDVVTLCDAVGHRLGLDDLLRRQLTSGAQLHDIGKVGIPLEILNKPSALTDAEWTVIREHTIIGERILRSVPAMSDIARIVRHSHEHWDGSGYPDGLKGDAIPLPSRVILCADAFHAMRSDRPYRRGRAAEAALAEIEACAGTQLDPAVAGAFLAVADDAQNGVPLRSDRFRKRRLIALLTALAIGTGSALGAIPALRDAIKSIFATSVPTTHASSLPQPVSDIGDSHGLRFGPLGDALRLPAADGASQTQQAPREHATASATPTGAAQHHGHGTRAGHKTKDSPTPTSEPVKSTKSDVPGRSLGRDVPVPRAPVQNPEGGRTDPPALGLAAGSNGAAQPPSRSARDRSATR